MLGKSVQGVIFHRSSSLYRKRIGLSKHLEGCINMTDPKISNNWSLTKNSNSVGPTCNVGGKGSYSWVNPTIMGDHAFFKTSSACKGSGLQTDSNLKLNTKSRHCKFILFGFITVDLLIIDWLIQLNHSITTGRIYLTSATYNISDSISKCILVCIYSTLHIWPNDQIYIVM